MTMAPARKDYFKEIYADRPIDEQALSRMSHWLEELQGLGVANPDDIDDYVHTARYLQDAASQCYLNSAMSGLFHLGKVSEQIRSRKGGNHQLTETSREKVQEALLALEDWTTGWMVQILTQGCGLGPGGR